MIIKANEKWQASMANEAKQQGWTLDGWQYTAWFGAKALGSHRSAETARRVLAQVHIDRPARTENRRPVRMSVTMEPVFELPENGGPRLTPDHRRHTVWGMTFASAHDAILWQQSPERQAVEVR